MASHDVVSFALDVQREYDPSQPLLIDANHPDRSLNGAQISLLVRTLIAGLTAQGLEKGDCVLVNMGNNVLYPPLFLAIIGAGGVYIGSNPRIPPDEVDQMVKLSRARWIITEQDSLSTIKGIADKNRINHIFIIDEADITTTIAVIQGTISLLPQANSDPTSFLSLLNFGTGDPVLIADEEMARSTPAALYTTSGTTGLPKAAVLSHASFISQHHSIVGTSPPPYAIRRLVCLPFYHGFSAVFTHLFPVRYGYPFYILPDFQLPVFLRAVQRYAITETYLVPAMIYILNQAPEGLQVSIALASMRYIGISGAPIDPAAMAYLQDNHLHPHACAGQIWGMTETALVFQNRYPASGRREDQGDLRSIGTLATRWEVKIGEAKKEASIQELVPGQLYVRGPGLVSGYLGHTEPFVDSQGWFATGDLAYVDEKQQYFILGRTKELIKVRGYSISPGEIENVLLKHPGIADAAVMGITLPDGTSEAPRAYVVQGEDIKLTSHQVYEFVQQQMASYKTLDGGVVFVESIPRTVTGKVRRGELTRLNGRREALAGLLGGRGHSG
ncbi:hypothetical protein ASPZODRAFT_73829 [Penicilliopsis zonata CBS 506.65]|uniref:AMP-dependent synthetase/ligase domain-containing protein n=1 Tax=Penicilliopsis zonata CBS 506.65 TaxID=1073090 RepID=A0A1L9S8M1_9EURO|nr:hypothetical protein ASPZODRAFT_73829 [Penicilliopsis zonata CBS 506.65]OJJ43494.1 hypothetical protein ASPZODRAFT_73829 [Penicilliopsis zonata CBS 506.65]